MMINLEFYVMYEQAIYYDHAQMFITFWSFLGIKTFDANGNIGQQL